MSIELVMDREAWRAAVHGVTKRWTWLSNRTEMNWGPPKQSCLEVVRVDILAFLLILLEKQFSLSFLSMMLAARFFFLFLQVPIYQKRNSVSSVSQSCPALCNPMDWSTPGFPVHHQLPEFAQTWVCNAIQPSHPLSSPSPTVFNLSQHQGLCQWVSSSHQVAKVLEVWLQHQSFQWIFRTGFL